MNRAGSERDLAGRRRDRPQLRRAVPGGGLRTHEVVLGKAVDAVLVDVIGEPVEGVRRLDAHRRRPADEHLAGHRRVVEHDVAGRRVAPPLPVLAGDAARLDLRPVQAVGAGRALRQVVAAHDDVVRQIAELIDQDADVVVDRRAGLVGGHQVDDVVAGDQDVLADPLPLGASSAPMNIA